MKKQPGVMLYFDIRDSISQLTQAEKGDLFDAILDYGQHQAEPAFTDRTLTLIWPFVRKEIHRDAERYEARRQAGMLGARKRWGNGSEMAADGTEMAENAPDMAKMPTTSPSAPPSSPAPAAAAPSTTAAAAAETETPPPAPSALPRTNGSGLPDIVAQYLPAKKTGYAEGARLKAEALAKLRALPPDA